MKCPICQAEMEPNIRFCGNCGCELPEHVALENVQPAEETVVETAQAQTIVVDTGAAVAAKKKFPVKVVIIAASAVFLLVVAVIVVWLLLVQPKIPYAFYVKDDELMLLNTQNNKIFAIGDEMFARNCTNVILSDDGKKMFFMQYAETNNATGVNLYDLYYRPTNDLESDPERLASDIRWFLCDSAGNTLVYISDTGVLYRHDLDNNERVSALGSLDNEYTPATPKAMLSSDGSRIVYLTSDGALGVKVGSSTAQTIASHVTDVYASSADLMTLYYLTDEYRLYKKSGDADAVLIDERVVQMSVITEDTFYYGKQPSYEAMLMDFVDNDIDLEKPVVPVVPDRVDYATHADYTAAQAAYQHALQAAAQYEMIHDLRTDLNQVSYTPYAAVDLYYYNGSASSLVLETAYIFDHTVDSDTALMVAQYQPGEIGRIKLSQLTSAYQLKDALDREFSDSLKTFIVKDGIAQANGIRGQQEYIVSDDGTKLVYAVENGSAYDIYYVVLSGTVVVSTEKIGQTEHLVMYGVTLKDGTFVFLVNGKLYANNGEIDDGLRGELTLSNDKTAVFYCKDYDEWKTATLMVYEAGKQPVMIDEETGGFTIDPSGIIVYLADYSAAKNRGALYYYKDGKHREIDEDVTMIVDYTTPSEVIDSAGSIGWTVEG